MLLGAPVLASIYKLPMGNVAGIITLGFVLSIFVSYLAGWVADRTNRAFFLAGVLIVFVICELLMTVHSLGVAEVAMVIGIAFGFTVPNTCFALSASAMAGREVGPIMGVTSVGMSLGVYLGPQLLGLMKDLTGGFNAGFYLEAFFALVACIIVVSLEFIMRKSRAAAR
jgi:predicted MFS family arabinose efflux permease